MTPQRPSAGHPQAPTPLPHAEHTSFAGGDPKTVLLPALRWQAEGKWGGQSSHSHVLWQDQPHRTQRNKRAGLVPVCTVAGEAQKD